MMNMYQRPPKAGPYTFNSAALTYDAGNRLGTYNGQTVNYDADGNMTRGPLAGDMENFTFDARSRLIGAQGHKLHL